MVPQHVSAALSFVPAGLGATLNVAKPKKGQSLAIFGLGTVGLAAAAGARLSGDSRIIGVDLNPNRFEEVGSLLMVHTPEFLRQQRSLALLSLWNPKDHSEPVQEVIAEMTNGGVDRSVECTGSIQAMISAFECVHAVNPVNK
ncbi:alcohol dehydrogenase 1-like [Syzygium oleosum]|uniref:alcohol dehydrogenase 1-like n=1 Tax=Syzygium oleosum TaxID=219896 RepID=UPI0024BA3208|nr:alcohol dehydrogenase 1-like [Syzygium oleosum]